ncbi:E3 ubiquitin-protein ligase TRIM56-like [Gigantopelta aegis]|uniref:E3 ubiquitin-protein ligase TRIM56-like n=1 Tax=Gigantopelta aegis TaxID=1735272 RepID=UPI001B887497|nr:E3 ubiquitin-protein ligase TRIM56-like [Gigantopelta aegis]
MASKQGISQKAISKDFLTCKICFNIYEQPKILPCVHTYCSHCLEKLFETSDEPGSILCPECRDSVTLSHKTVSDLKTNFLINSLIEVLKVKTNKDVKCTTCTLRGNTSPAKCRCLDCGDYLCPRCSDGHNASSTTWNHKKVLLKDIRKGSYDKELRNLLRLTCSQHKDKEIEYFCGTCHTPICLACVFLEHREHICLTASEAVVAQKDRLVNYAAKVNEKLQHLENEKKVVCENFARVNKHQTEANTKIEKQIEGIIAQIEQHRQQALQLVEDRIDETLKQCSSQVEQAYLKITLAKGCLEFCETMIEHGKDEDVLYLEETITKRLQQLEELPTVDLKPIAREVFPDINNQHTRLRKFTDCANGILLERFTVSICKPLANLSVDKSGYLVTCEWGDNCIRVRDLHGTKLTSCQVPPTWKPFAAHEDRNGFIYVVNNSQHAVSVFDQDGTDILHHATIPDGLQKPLNLAFDDEGLMYLVNIFGYINVYKVSVERLTVNASRELGSTAWYQ